MNFPSNFPELRPPSKEKETPAALTDPQIRYPKSPDPQTIMAMAKIATQTNYQSKIGNPLAVSGPYGLGAINPMMSPNAGREVLTTQSPLTGSEIDFYSKGLIKESAKELLKQSGILARGASPAVLAWTSIQPLTLTADVDSERLGLYNGLLKTTPEDMEKMRLLHQAQIKTQTEVFEKQRREREERWASMKSDELNKKLQSADDHITHYFSRRAIK